MVELLTIEKRRLLAEHGHVTRQDFEEAWERCWHVMVLERAWPHATRHRRAWRQAQDETKLECCAAFLGEPTPFSFAATRLEEAASGMCLRLPPEQLGRAILAVISYCEVDDERAAVNASNAAQRFVAGVAAQDA